MARKSIFKTSYFGESRLFTRANWWLGIKGPPGGAGTGEEGEEGEEGGKKEGRKRLWKASYGLGRLENAIGMHA